MAWILVAYYRSVFQPLVNSVVIPPKQPDRNVRPGSGPHVLLFVELLVLNANLNFLLIVDHLLQLREWACGEAGPPDSPDSCPDHSHVSARFCGTGWLQWIFRCLMPWITWSPSRLSLIHLAFLDIDSLLTLNSLHGLVIKKQVCCDVTGVAEYTRAKFAIKMTAQIFTAV